MSEVRGEVMPTYGSLFAGVGGFDMGFDRTGYDCRFQVEWDKNCQNILNRHWPDVPKWWDVSEVNGAELPPVDVLIFGSPCQDLSVAGKRAGLDGARSGLFYEAMRIIKEMRNATGNTFPRVVVWENVVGALNSNGGADFGAVLNQMAEAGALVVEWAVLDAQHFGVPQRRRRVFVVAVLDPASAGRCPDPLLPVRESVRGDSKKGRKKGEAAPGEAGGGVAVCDGQPTVMACIEATDGRKWGSSQWVDNHKMIVQPYVEARRAQSAGGDETFGNDSYGGWKPADQAVTLSARDYKQGTTLAVAFTKSRRAQSAEDDETWVDGKVAPTLNQFDTGDIRTTVAVVGSLQARDYKGTNHEGARDGKLIIEPIPIHDQATRWEGKNGNRQVGKGNGLGIGRSGQPMNTLTQGDKHAVAQPLSFDTQFGSNANVFADQSPTLKSTQQSPSVLGDGMIVRRLTPVECERLMGWPDDHTRWTADGKEQADTHRYRQCGNGVATPVAQWIARHLLPVLDVPLPVAE